MGILSSMDRRNQRTLEHHNEVARHGVAVTPAARVVILVGATVAMISLVVALVAILVESL